VYVIDRVLVPALAVVNGEPYYLTLIDAASSDTVRMVAIRSNVRLCNYASTDFLLGSASPLIVTTCPVQVHCLVEFRKTDRNCVS
jgi:hypothetical protein